MKTKMFKRALSVLLVLMLCVSVLTPAVSAATDASAAALGDGEEIPVVALHSSGGNPLRASINKSDVQQVFEDLGLGEGSYYGIKSKTASGNPTNLSGLSSSTNVNAGEYIIYRTAVTSGSIIKTPNWSAGVSQDITVRLYFTANFSVSGCDDGEIYLDGEAVSGNVDLYTDTEYTVTAKTVDDYTYTISGATDGEAFTPSSDMTITAEYAPNARATVSKNVTGEGTAKIMVDGEEVNGVIGVGASFEVETQANTDKGYKLDSIVVTKNGEEIEAVDGKYGPAENGDEFAVNVTFVFDPDEVDYEVSASSPILRSSDFNTMFGESGTRSYGYASADDPENISSLSLLNGNDFSAGEYYIYSTSYSLLNPNWANGKVKKMNLRTFYTADFTVSGNEDGEVYVNDIAVADNTAKLYTDSEYTITAKQIDDYLYTMTGAEDGVAFTPTADIDVVVAYFKEAYATFALNINGEGNAVVKSGGEVVTERVSEGETFTVEAAPNTDRGYKLDSIVVTKDGAEVEAIDGAYGPVADGESYVITVNFKFEPDEVDYEVSASSPRLRSSDFNTMFGESGTRSYGYASVDDPENISSLSLLNGNDFSAGEYYIYSTSYSLLNPNWSNAKVKKMDLRTFYTANFSVNGNDEGEVYVNDLEVAENVAKLYSDSEYTITAKQIDDYLYTMTGAEDGVAFTPTADIDVVVAYFKEAYATFALNINGEGNAVVKSGGEVVTERVSEGDTFTVEAAPNTDRGYKLDSIVVTKDDEEVGAVDGVYGPVADGESYVINVNFKFEPDEVDYELHADSKLTSTIVKDFFGDSLIDMASKSYGFASVDTPGEITNASVTGNKVEAGEYYIYRADSLLNPNWSTAKVFKLNLKTYYNGTFTVSGHDEGEVYLNREPVSGNVRLYTDTEYAVTAKDIDEYEYEIEGVMEGALFTPAEDVDVTVTYSKLAYATFTLNVGDGGEATVRSGDFIVTERISESETFTVEASPNTDKGYKLDSIVVTKDGAEVEAVDGVYGPVADGESYVINVNFKFEPDEVDYELHADSKFTSGMIHDLFGDSLIDIATKSYGFASVDTPGEITNATLTGNEVEAGEYYIYRTSLSTNPNWDNAKILKLNLRTFYNGTFTVSGHDDGEVYLNDEATTGTVKLYTDEQYTVTTKQIDEFICSLYGAEDGVEFTPTEDIEVSAVYMKEKYATITVNANEGGTVKVVSDGDEVFDKVPEDSTFTVVATANANNDYYIQSIVVTKDGEEVEAVDGEYGPVMDGESYEVTVTFAKATLTLNDGEVSLRDIFYKDYDAVVQSVVSCAELLPEELADAAQFEVEYAAYNILGYEVFEPLNYSSDLSHPFGTSELGGTLKGGNTERVRVTVTLPNYGIELRATAMMTVNDDRVETAIESVSDTLTITYGDDLKAAILEMISVTCVDGGEPVEFTADEIKIDPSSLNANLLSAYRAQEVTVQYKGNDIYTAAETTFNVYVQRAQSTLDTKSETITYGEIPEAKVITTPENLDYIKVIAGIDGEAQGYVSIDIPNSVKERMQIKIGGVVVLDIYQILSNYIGEGGATLNTLKDFVTDIYDRINSNELIRQAIENSGFNMEIFDSIIGFIEELPDFDSNLKIRLGQMPENTGAYLLFAVSTDTNYTTSADLSYILIKPKTTTEDETIELRFKEEMQGGTMHSLSYEEAQNFTFGGDFYINDELTETDKLHTLYVGTTFGGEFISQSEPVTKPGIYTETVYILGGNYFAEPLIRAYTINCIEAQLVMEDLTVPYDGEAHTIEASLSDGAEMTGSSTTIYTGLGYLSRQAPVDAGEYTVYTIYAGDATHMACSAYAKLTIEKLDATITVSCKDELTYGEISLSDISAADIQYTVSGTIEGDTLGTIIPVLTPSDNLPNVGEYTATVLFVQTNDNYNVTIGDATLTIVPKKISIAIDSAEKYAGDNDPEFTYVVTDEQGEEIDVKPDMTIAREEGEEEGEYRIYISEFNDSNYVLEEATDGVLTIKHRSQLIMDDLTVPYDGEAHTVEARLDDGAEMTGVVTTYYVGSGYYSRQAPVNVGEYTVYTYYAGDENHSDCSASAKLTIEKRDAVINVTCKEEFTYGDISIWNILDVDLGYTVSGVVDGDRIGIIVPELILGSNFPNVGEYTATAAFVQTNSNYNVTIENATLTIVPKQITITIDNAEKYVGEDDPEFTYTATDDQGRPIRAQLDLKLAREEGEAAGEYSIFVSEFNETNYVIDSETSTDGILTIKNKFLIGDVNFDGTVDILDAVLVQKYAADMTDFTDDQLYVGDVNDDGTVDIFDAVMIQRYAVDYISEFPKKG